MNFRQQDYFTVLLGLALVALLQPSALSQTDENWRWVNDNYDAAFDQAFPLHSCGGICVSVRCHRDLHHDVPEWSLTLYRDYQTRTVEWNLREAVSEPIADQLYRLHRDDRHATVQVLVGRLRLRERKGSEKGCPEARVAFDTFYQLRLPMMTEAERTELAQGMGTITLHPTIYEFGVDVTDGHASLYIIDAPHPFVTWADTARQHLGRCQ